MKIVLSVSTFGIFALCLTSLQGQKKHDFQWIIGYDYSGLPDQIISIDFLDTPMTISHVPTINKFGMEGSNTSMCDENGNLLFYSNGCSIVSANGELMQNGDSINPGLIQDVYCTSGGSPWSQGVIAIPSPEKSDIFYVFNLDMDLPYVQADSFIGIAPQRLYYQVIDMSQSGGNGKVILKNQIAILDTLSRGNIQAVKHANEIDWWIVTPKSHSNCYFLTLVTESGVEDPILECEGPVWNDLDTQGQSVFSPDGTKYVRFNGPNGLDIFDFNTENGNLSNPIHIDFPNDTFYFSGAAISPNSRFLYASAKKHLYQFDLWAPDIQDSKILVGTWDGYHNPYATIFYLAALAPDGKIYISSTSSTLNLHVIEKPNCPGLSCQLIQHGIDLPSLNFATIPNSPHYQIGNVACTSTNNEASNLKANKPEYSIYPNPAKDIVWINFPNLEERTLDVTIYDPNGQEIIKERVDSPLSRIDVSQLDSGVYYYSIITTPKISYGSLIIN